MKMLVKQQRLFFILVVGRPGCKTKPVHGLQFELTDSQV